ncbi:MAG: tetratricopeptide repeat protein [Planctomycetota bacterium]|nr:tetratricopeptide repeat protein [Planctomycetota bacterium]
MTFDSIQIPDLHTRLASSPCLQGERVAFTGTLASMTHRQAYEFVERHGGTPSQHVSRQTTMLVVGEEGWPLDPDGQPSQKLRHTQLRQQEGAAIQIVNESDWLQLLGLDEQRREVHRNYTPAMLSKLLDVPVSTIRSWERVGLIRPVRKVHRLPYFDFQEVTSARRLSELLAAGVARTEIESSLRKLESFVGNVARPLAQLELLERDSHVIYRDGFGLLQAATGQRLLDFDEADGDAADDELLEADVVRFPDAAPSQLEPDRVFGESLGADDWFDRGSRLASEGRLDAAVQAFRMSLMEFPGDPDASFHLAETLYRLGNVAGALERFYSTVEIDRYYVEAWTQIGCLHVELGELDIAVNTFDVALQLHPDFPDAHWHKADVLHLLGRVDEAIEYWESYLKFDSRGPWAENARMRLTDYQTTDGRAVVESITATDF